MHKPKSLTLRPRLTIHPALHPELYEILANIEPENINAMIFQMLVKQAYLDKCMSIGLLQGVVEQPKQQTKQQAQKPADAAQSAAPFDGDRSHSDSKVAVTEKSSKTTSKAVQSEHDAKRVDEVDATTLKGALSGLSIGF